MSRKSDWGYQSIPPSKEYRERYELINWGDAVPPIEDQISEILHIQRCCNCEDRHAE